MYFVFLKYFENVEFWFLRMSFGAAVVVVVGGVGLMIQTERVVGEWARVEMGRERKRGQYGRRAKRFVSLLPPFSHSLPHTYTPTPNISKQHRFSKPTITRGKEGVSFLYLTLSLSTSARTDCEYTSPATGPCQQGQRFQRC